MKKTSKTVVFFGNERLATGVSTTAPTLRALIEAGYGVAAVVSHLEASQSRNARNLEIADVAKEHNIPLLLPNKPAEIRDRLAAMNADVGVLVAYGKIVPESIINLFPRGIINIHPSKLPEHRGPTPVESVILDGSNSTAVSVMALVKAMDAGPVYAQQEVELTGHEEKQELSEKLVTVGKDLIINNLPAILDGSLVPAPQDEATASYDQLITKQDGVIDWSKPAVQLEREVRAYKNWPKSRTSLAGKDVVITEAEVIDRQGDPAQLIVEPSNLIVCCGKDSLKIKSLIPAGKKEMPVSAFLAGYKQFLV